jgi:hypothetical protein
LSKALRPVSAQVSAWLSVGVALALVLSTAGCSEDEQPSADKCEQVSVPLTDVPTRTDQEPRMRIPQPPGWERTTKLDNETIRFAIRNPALADEGFTPNAVVTLQQIGAEVGKPQQILDAQNQQLQLKMKVNDLQSHEAQVCGLPAALSNYTAPAMGKIPARKATSIATVFKSGDTNYVATVTVQAIKPDNPGYAHDSEVIIKGFQLLPAK